MDPAHGEPRIIPADWFDRGFDAYPISDYHTMGFVEGRAGGSNWVAYTGSAVRRGWSDDECDRGWLKINLLGDACRDALDGWCGAKAARRSFVRAADRAGLLPGRPRSSALAWRRPASAEIRVAAAGPQ